MCSSSFTCSFVAAAPATRRPPFSDTAPPTPRLPAAPPAGRPSGGQHADAARRLDLVLRLPGEVPGLHDQRLLRQGALAEDLEVARLDDVDDRGLVLDLRVVRAGALRDQGPELLHVDRGADLPVLDEVEVAHAHLAEVAGVVLVEVDAVVVLPAGVPAAAGVLAVLADAALAGGDLAAHVAVLLVAGRHRNPPLAPLEGIWPRLAQHPA